MWTTLFFRVLLLSTVTIATASIASDDVLIARLNYGVVMKRVAVIDIVTDSWNQAFIVRLPVIESSVTEPNHINCTNITTRTLKATCLRLRPMVLYLHNASVKAVERIHTVIHYIRSIVPEHVSARVDRQRSSRALLGIGGEILHGLFGTARDSDIDNLRHAIVQLRRQNVHTMSAWQDVTGRFAGLIKTSNRRIDNLRSMAETQGKAIDTLFQELSVESVESAKVASLLVSALTRLEDFILLLDSLERLAAGVESLTHGFLSPSLLPSEELRHSLEGIDARVLNTGLRVLRRGPAYYYGMHNFVAAREGDNLVINIHIPLSGLPTNLPLYQVHVFPLPVPNTDGHATVVVNVPKFFVLLPSLTYHLSFDGFPKIKPSNLIYLEDTKGVVESTDNLACVVAIQQNDKAAVHRVCKFNLVTDFIKPGVFAINRSHVFLTNVNVSIQCPTRPTRSVNCSSTCQLTPPCRCDLTSPVGFIPKRVDDCVHHRDIVVEHSVNLALLQQFFSESELSGISGDTLLPDPLRVRLPNLKIFQAQFSHEIEEDKRAKFDLEQISNLTKKDEQAFASLAHSMVGDWQGYRDRSFENDFIFGSWKSWIMPGVGATAVLALIISVMLSYKLRALSSSLALLSLSNKAHAMPTALNFYTTTLQTSLAAHSSTVSTALICDIVIMFFLAVIVVLFAFRLYRKRCFYKFDLYLYVGNQHRCRSIFIRSFCLEPALYTFKATRYIENMSLHGCLLPYLTLDWPTLTIRSSATNESYTLPRVVSLSWRQRSFLSSVLSRPYWCVMVTNFNGHFALLDLPSREWDEAPAYDRTLRTQMSHAVSLTTVSPTAPGIYPQLTTVSEDGKD